MKTFIHSILLLFVLALLSSCKKEMQAEIPSYLSIGEISVTDSTGKLVSSDAEDAWVYIDDKLKGAFQLPTKLPVLEKGVHQVDIRAGVVENGIYDLKVKYPFYEVYSELVDFGEEEINHLDPVITYTEFTKINTSWAGADFEGGINFNPSHNTDTFFVQTPNNTGNPVYGNYVGTFYLTADDEFFEAYSDPITNVPRNDPEVWMEMDYISDATIVVGLYREGMTDQYPLVFFKPQSKWTKVYIKLAAGILSYPNATDYQFFIGCKKNNSLSTSVTSIDNVKLLHY